MLIKDIVQEDLRAWFGKAKNVSNTKGK